jgi:tetratricopeptide (TPR) repeat protein
MVLFAITKLNAQENIRFQTKTFKASSSNFLVDYFVKKRSNRGLHLESLGDFTEALLWYKKCTETKHPGSTFCADKVVTICIRNPSICSTEETKAWYAFAIERYSHTIAQQLGSEGSNVSITTRNSVLSLLSAKALLQYRFDDIKNALKTWLAALSLYEDASDHSQRELSTSADEICYHIGLAYQHLGNIFKAHKYYWMALRMNPNHIRSSLNIAVILQQNQQYGEGLYHYENAIRQFSTASFTRDQIVDYKIGKFNRIMLLCQSGYLREVF